MLENPAITNMSATVDWVEDQKSSPMRGKMIVKGATAEAVQHQIFSLMMNVELFGGWAEFSHPYRQPDGTFAALGVVEAEAAPCSAI